MTINNVEQWCIKQHGDTNHMYDHYLPYEFHLRMVVNVYKQFRHLLPKDDYWTDPFQKPFENDSVTWSEVIIPACWGHDLIEDTRTSYNDVERTLGIHTADIIYAVTNNKGKTRSERADDAYYEGIRKTKGATFVKLCDRIANVQYSKLTKSRMFSKYKDENPGFIEQVNADLYPDMKNYLIKLFGDE